MSGRYPEEIVKIRRHLCLFYIPDTFGGVLARASLVGFADPGGSRGGGFHRLEVVAKAAKRLVGGRL